MLLAILLLSAFAPNLNPITWRLEATPQHFNLLATVAEHYKLYGPTKSKGGPIPLTVKAISPKTLRLGPIQGDNTTFQIPYKLKQAIPPEGLTATIEIRYQSCSGEICLPPTTRTLTSQLPPRAD